ncbi:GPW/gp25 family protein [Desulfobacter postgatei]|uniref:Phage baseplate assembly protein W n=1 Tax=Desulfobacter postgatei 2ac9 TaxID=879212 RepID=I5B7H2_9BACT|nr:GPW/gp25 family protein [Desulfobacter postgatei]EIM65435.1 phage baseplate assembly protein W [Desulfobacter postgatei 2ac9]
MVERAYTGEGFGFPVALDETGRVVRVSDTAAIDRSIELILLTAKGERIMRPDFGSDLSTFVFKPLSEQNRRRMGTSVKTALQKWEPRIRLLAVEVRVSPKGPNIAEISIDYKVRQTHTKHNLVFPFYLGGTGQ